jgi:hypothetical protein
LAVILYQFASERLKRDCELTIVMPDFVPGKSGESLDDVYRGDISFSVLWLLPDAGQASSTWLRRTQLEEYLHAAPRRIAAFCPQGPTDGEDREYEAFVGDELYSLARLLLPVSSAGEDNAIGGFAAGERIARSIERRFHGRYLHRFPSRAAASTDRLSYTSAGDELESALSFWAPAPAGSEKQGNEVMHEQL